MSKGRVLLVDDRPEFVKALAERVASRGYEVGAAGSGPEALQALREAAYDVVVLDMVMPGMDGLETLRRLRENDQAVAVIVLTGYGSSREVDQAMSLGANDYLVKPADLDDLLERVDLALANKAGR